MIHERAIHLLGAFTVAFPPLFRLFTPDRIDCHGRRQKHRLAEFCSRITCFDRNLDRFDSCKPSFPSRGSQLNKKRVRTAFVLFFYVKTRLSPRPPSYGKRRRRHRHPQASQEEAPFSFCPRRSSASHRCSEPSKPQPRKARILRQSAPH